MQIISQLLLKSSHSLQYRDGHEVFFKVTGGRPGRDPWDCKKDLMIIINPSRLYPIQTIKYSA